MRLGPPAVVRLEGALAHGRLSTSFRVAVMLRRDPGLDRGARVVGDPQPADPLAVPRCLASTPRRSPSSDSTQQPGEARAPFQGTDGYPAGSNRVGRLAPDNP